MLTYIDCCDDIFYLRALCQIHLQTQPKAVKAIKSLLRQLSAQTWLHQMLALPIYVQKSHLHPQFGNISGLKPMKNDNAKPTCKLCLKKVSAAGGNTSNLQQHFRDHHPANAQKLGKQA
jgi:hypothetical protein